MFIYLIPKGKELDNTTIVTDVMFSGVISAGIYDCKNHYLIVVAESLNLVSIKLIIGLLSEVIELKTGFKCIPEMPGYFVDPKSKSTIKYTPTLDNIKLETI